MAHSAYWGGAFRYVNVAIAGTNQLAWGSLGEAVPGAFSAIRLLDAPGGFNRRSSLQARSRSEQIHGSQTL